MRNLILNTDSYKTSHYLQYPEGTEYVSSYIESRGGRFDRTLFFGLQMFVKETLLQPVSHEEVEEADAVCALHGVPFNREGWNALVRRYGGRLPLEIEAVPEGSLVPNRNVLLQVVNTDPQFFWLTAYIETALLRAIWYPSTVATLSHACRQVIATYLRETADDLSGLAFKLHDFGARGASSEQTAALGGAAHLVNFLGTDTLSAVLAARRYYGAEMAGFSIPAAEHSTITAWGRDGEGSAYANMLKQFGGKGKVLAVVSDSYDLFNAIDHLWGETLRDWVQQMGGTLVIRPDSGNPVEIVPEALERLMARFGSRTNTRGYRVLPDCVRLIQGDGITVDSIGEILEALKQRGLSADNLAFGMGGGLLQHVNRDTQQFAMKASAIRVAGHWRDIRKDPATDPGKRSKAGRLALVHDADGYRTVSRDALGTQHNALIPVFRNGELLVDWRFDDIRDRAARG